MNTVKFLLLVGYLFVSAAGHAQEDVAYKFPPKVIAEMLLAKPTPNVSLDDKAEWMLFTESNSYPSVEELAKPELRIAGLRINPANFAGSRQTFVNNLYLKNLKAGQEYKIAGLPSPLFASAISWSPDFKRIAFTHTTSSRIDLYVVDVASRSATRINKSPLNGLMSGYQWFENNTLMYRTTLKPASAAPVKGLMPKGPATQENYGKASPRPTFQDMLKTPYDEELFSFYTTAQLVKNTAGVETKIGVPAIHSLVSPSPDKKFLLIRTLKKPFSYLVPAGGFTSTVTVTDMSGKVVKVIAELPSSETAPGGNDNVQMVPRAFEWRDDLASTLIWCMALDSGMIKKEAAFRDAVYEQAAPFTQQPKELFKTKMRYRNTTWGNNNIALVTEGLTGKQTVQLSHYNPAAGTFETLLTRNSTDAYANPGFPVTTKNEFGKDVIKTIDNGTKLLMNNTVGSSGDGDLPFLAAFDLKEKKSSIIWRSQPGSFEYVVKVIDPDNLQILTRKESETDMPNYWIKDLKRRIADRSITSFTSPYPQLAGVKKEKIKYKRADGVSLTGDLYVPKGYDPKTQGKLPLIIWAYPAEYNSAADAAQIRGSEHKFTLLNWASPVFYVTQGYAVLNNAEMPIVAVDKDKKPNDNFIDQLRMNAEAAINTLDAMGVADRSRVAIGGHSYGAFMTANLLAHTKLFRAGIARSGAYNRSLTPFGFQNEDRTYWQAPDLYNAMSPFSVADKIKTPLLLIHGELDNNTGTYPIQSERMFNAIKGLGGTVKYISLPYESHSYAGKENLLHMLNEQLLWLEKYVKKADANGAAAEKSGSTKTTAAPY